jgi:hypothetical protein
MIDGALCDDWSCPAKVSCMHHFGRSKAYAAMTLPAPQLRKPPRKADAECCAHYVTDRPRAWLLASMLPQRWGDHAPGFISPPDA